MDELMSLGDLAPDFEAVRGVLDLDGVEARVFQQASPTAYGHRPTDELMIAVSQARRVLWRSIFSSEPYRRYYLYQSPPGEVRLHQLLSTHALMFFLGSATRYQPKIYLAALEGPYAAFLREFLASQPSQFLFGIASEFSQREISRAAVV